MDSLSPITDDDDREDGEIIDDDFADLEEISNYSIPSCGKSDYSQDLFRTISLSSISESDDDCVYLNSYNHYHRHYDQYLSYKSGDFKVVHHRKSKRSAKPYVRDAIKLSSHKRKRKRRKRTQHSLAALKTAEKLDEKTLQQLKEAIRIDDSCNADKEHHNTLKNRLKCMLGQDFVELETENFDDDDSKGNISTLCPVNGECNANEKTPEDSDDESAENMDLELAQLRLEALKSAMLKKAKERKIRQQSAPLVAIQKEESENTIEQNNKENEEVENCTPLNDKQTEKVPESPIEEDIDIMRAMLLASMSKKITSATFEIPEPSPNLSVLQNKPVQSNPLVTFASRESKSNSFSSNNNNLVTQALPTILPIKPLIIRVNNDSDSDSDINLEESFEGKKDDEKIVQPIVRSVDELLRKQREQFEAKLKLKEKITKENNNLIDKSVLKLLPKQQQQEYQQLKKKLLALKRERRKNVAKKLIGNNATAKATTSEEDRQEIKTLTQDTMQERKAGKRLQMKGKYKDLAPILKSVNSATAAKKKCEERIRTLLGQLREARTELAEHQQNYSALVKNLADAKKDIDNRCITATAKPVVETKDPETVVSDNTDNKTQSPTQAKKRKKLQPTNESLVSNTKEIVEIVPTITTITKSITTTTIMTSIPTTTTSSTETKVSDENKMSNYVSPLDKRENQPKNNPLEMLCPYELFGMCKDPNCTFNHCPT